MITSIQVRNRRLIRKYPALMLFHGPKSRVPEVTPTSAAGIWGGQGTGKSSLVDQIAWLAHGVQDNGAAWRQSIPIEPNHEPGRDDEKTTTCVIRTLDESGEYEYALTATAEGITAEQLWHRPGTPGDDGPHGKIVFTRSTHSITMDSDLTKAGLDVGPDDTRMPVLANDAADQNPVTRTIRNEIRRITVVRPSEEIYGDFEIAARAIEVEEPGQSPAGLRRRLIQGLLENLGIKLGNLDDEPSRTVRDRLGAAGDGALRATAIAVHAAHALTHGGLLVVDPIDSGIHGAWSRQLVETFTGQPETSLKRGQLLFTTGSIDLLTALPHDQVWLADLVNSHHAIIESLASFKNIERTKLREAYEAGRFGGVPGHAPTTLQRTRNEIYKRQREEAAGAAARTENR